MLPARAGGLTNIVRHSGARHGEVTVSIGGGAVDVVVRDDGRGFDVCLARRRAVAGGSVGLLSMEERVALAGGQLAIDSVPGGGTLVRAHVPSGGAAR